MKQEVFYMWEVSSTTNLKGQVAIITGAGRGIGAACAYALARQGANVVIVDILPADDILSKIKHDFPDVEAVAEQIDIRHRNEVKEAIDRTVNRWGRLDIVVNNAGTCSRLNLENMTEEDWERDMNTNLKATFLFTQLAVFPYMKNQKYGKIINISSISGMNGGAVSNIPGTDQGRSGPAYAASKGGIIALTKWVAKEVGKYGIYCNSIAPGVVQTELTKGMDYHVEQQPIARAGSPVDIAEAVVYFASPASNYVTGQILRVCGGSVMG
jgi:3-oxoacyl-[acyl-carrier protein] reductase